MPDPGRAQASGVTNAAMTLFFAVLMALFFSRTVPVPIYDAWELVPLLEAGEMGGLELHDLWAQHNEHRPFFPRVIMLTMAAWTHWDVRWELALNVLLGGGLALLLGLVLTRQLHAPPLLALLLVGLLLSPSQWQNWMLGWQLQLWLSMLCGVAGLFLACWAGSSGLWGSVALALGVVSFYSFASGALFLTTVSLCMLVQKKKSFVSLIALSCLMSAFALYVYGFDPVPQEHGRPGPGGVLLYLLVWLGQPLAPYHPLAACATGVIGLGATLFLLGAQTFRVRRTEHQRLLLGLIAFSLGAGLLAAWGRGALGADQALSSRYITLANPFWVALLALTSMHFDAGEHRSVKRVVFGLVAGLILGGWLYGAYRWDERYDAYRLASEALVAGHDDPALRFLYPDLETLRARRAFLVEHELTVFRP